MTAEPKQSRPFTHIDTWVFDLDNTLYPHHVNLWQQVDVRIGEFVSAWLKISADEARRIQKDYYRRYGTTMRGMMTEHGVHADDYLAYVHQIDHSPLQPNPAMGATIAKLPGRKLILTNGSTDHAGKVLERLGIGAHFEAVFDIIAAELEPKPAPQTYQKFLRDHGVDPTRSAMFEDLARNLVVPHQLGMTTVLVVPDGTREVVREDWELEGRGACCRARGQRQVESQPVAEEGSAAVVSPQRHERDLRRPRPSGVVGQGAVEIRWLGREPVSRRGLSRRPRRHRPPLGLHRQKCRADAVLCQPRRLCR